MNLEQTLTDELRVVADGLQAPPPPATAELARAAGRSRRRSRLTRTGVTGLVAAAVVGAVVLGSQLGKPDAAPQPARPTPTSYYAPGVPYLHEGALYVAHRRQPGQWFTVQSYGDYTIALAADSTGAVFHQGTQVLRLDPVVQAVSLSFDGTKAAWIASDGHDRGVLVVRDLPGSRELGRQPLVLGRGNKGYGVTLTVRDDGTVFYGVDNQDWTWRPGLGDPRRTATVPSDIPLHPSGFSGVRAPVRLSPDHLWGAWVTDAGAGLAVTVQKPDDPASRFTMALPPVGDMPRLVFWGSPTELVFPTSEKLRCDIVARHCRVAEGP